MSNSLASSASLQPTSSMWNTSSAQLRRCVTSLQCKHLYAICNGYLKPYGREALRGPGKHGLVAHKSRHTMAIAATSTETTAVSSPSTSPAPPALTGAEIRERFLAFYEGKGHTRMPSSSLVPEDPTVLLTIAGMLQFKPVFLGQEPRAVPCATTTQKCVRTNDIENVGVTARHHTFFEMLGNFSFGDYFKEKAIEMAWELTTKVFQVPQERVWVSVYEEDDEAYALWRDVVGVPESRIKRMGAADNFWASGPTGPCGPCSELYYDFHPERGLQGADLEDDTRFIEFYNLVFMESNKGPDGALSPLEAKNIDTGMGLERMAQILQQVPNNYETDLIFPIVQQAAKVAGVEYSSADARTQTALKVIGDHIRAVAYLISDGVTPSNVGRGYVVRRLLRRVILKGRLLGIREPFTPAVAQVAIDLSTGCDAQVTQQSSRILRELQREETRFLATLEAGQKVLQQVIDEAVKKSGGNAGEVSGKQAFLLYDTFGFPLEITQELAAEQGLTVDLEGFSHEMEAQRQRSKEALKTVDLTAQAALGGLVAEVGETEFLGYDDLTAEGAVVAIMRDGASVTSASAGDTIELVLDRTPFYAESGGQIGDHGIITVPGQHPGQPPAAVLHVGDVTNAAGGDLSVHRAEVLQGRVQCGDKVVAEVDPSKRHRARCNHTSTHLLQSALKQVLGDEVSQQGSLVEFDRLRFDFNLPRPMTPQEINTVETLINSWIQSSTALTTRVMPLTEAKAGGATAMFGEKYSDVVRVVEVPGVSMELCGGTHVASTGDIGGFKVLSETGIASGIRRIEAVSGPALIDYVNTLDTIVRGLSSTFKVKQEDIPQRVADLLNDLKAKEKQIETLKSSLALAKAANLGGLAVTTATGAPYVVERLDGVDAKAMQDAAASVQAQLGEQGAVVLGGSPEEGKVVLVAAFGKEVISKGLQAGKFVGGIAKLCGGGGGGKPNLAQAGGRDASKLDEALASAKQQLEEGLGA